MLFRPLAALGLLVWAIPRPAAADPEEMSSETPYPGITYTLWVDADVPARLHVVSVDLSSAEIDLIATAEDQRGLRPSELATAVGAVVAINGDYFNPNGFWPAGLARGQSQTWAGTSDDALSGFIRFHRDFVRTQAVLSPPVEVVDQVPEETVGVVGGRPLLVQSGQPVGTYDCSDLVAMPCEPAPRTAVALSQDRNTLWMIVVDGWQADSFGLSAGQLASFIDGELDAYQALLLDGGSASALWLDGALVSSPSDGVERPVSNHLAVRHGDLADGLILGVVAEGSVDGPRIPGALVTIDDGRQKTFDGETLWSFSVRPRWACVTATADGYEPGTQCRQVPSGGEIYASIALQPSTGADAGPGAPDGGGEQPDAGPRPDGGDEQPGADAGGPGDDPGGGCGCRAASPGAPALPLLCLLAALVLRGGLSSRPRKR
ncbi:MAG TPA: phosphodiester glycosidase family protein [Kofleriaceae bacterium]|nr:phosphodiester glycosidase family protein [Kofleriaceae bacterium]